MFVRSQGITQLKNLREGFHQITISAFPLGCTWCGSALRSIWIDQDSSDEPLVAASDAASVASFNRASLKPGIY
jgi:hypothetical protein